jgi:hypothetical protein
MGIIVMVIIGDKKYSYSITMGIGYFYVLNKLTNVRWYIFIFYQLQPFLQYFE